jgi:hypothetical protein
MKTILVSLALAGLTAVAVGCAADAGEEDTETGGNSALTGDLQGEFCATITVINGAFAETAVYALPMGDHEKNAGIPEKIGTIPGGTRFALVMDPQEPQVTVSNEGDSKGTYTPIQLSLPAGLRFFISADQLACNKSNACNTSRTTVTPETAGHANVHALARNEDFNTSLAKPDHFAKDIVLRIWKDKSINIVFNDKTPKVVEYVPRPLYIKTTGKTGRSTKNISFKECGH